MYACADGGSWPVTRQREDFEKARVPCHEGVIDLFAFVGAKGAIRLVVNARDVAGMLAEPDTLRCLEDR
jgi:hypothetical protein